MVDDNLSGTYAPVPEECVPDLDGTYHPEAHYTYGSGVRETITAVFADGALLSVDGHECIAIRPGQSPTYSECTQNYVCGCCRWQVDNAYTGDTEFHLDPYASQCESSSLYEVDQYDIGGADCTYDTDCLANEYCDTFSGRCTVDPDYCDYDYQCGSNEYCNQAIHECQIDPCDDCLDTCLSLGLPGCCCGTGCLCETECNNCSF